MNKSKVMAVAGVFVLAFLLPVLSSANMGFYIGTGIGYDFPNQSGDVMDELEPENGVGLELIHLGYNFNDNLGIGLQYGAGAGTAEDILGDDTTWGQGYLTFSGRYTFADMEPVTPYVELGLGNYLYMIDGDDGDLTSDPVVGGRLAVGGSYYLGNFYIGPELSYHFAGYEDAELDSDRYGEGDVDFEETGDMLMLLVKVGYHWRQ